MILNNNRGDTHSVITQCRAQPTRWIRIAGTELQALRLAGQLLLARFVISSTTDFLFRGHDKKWSYINYEGLSIKRPQKDAPARGVWARTHGVQVLQHKSFYNDFANHRQPLLSLHALFCKLWLKKVLVQRQGELLIANARSSHQETQKTTVTSANSLLRWLQWQVTRSLHEQIRTLDIMHSRLLLMGYQGSEGQWGWTRRIFV